QNQLVTPSGYLVSLHQRLEFDLLRQGLDSLHRLLRPALGHTFYEVTNAGSEVFGVGLPIHAGERRVEMPFVLLDAAPRPVLGNALGHPATDTRVHGVTQAQLEPSAEQGLEPSTDLGVRGAGQKSVHTEGRAPSSDVRDDLVRFVESLADRRPAVDQKEDVT